MDVLVQYTMRPSCLRALDGDQSRGFGASAVTRVWIPEVFLPVADRPRGLIHFDWIIPRDWWISNSSLLNLVFVTLILHSVSSPLEPPSHTVPSGYRGQNPETWLGH
jgi:hypothetical protein